MIKVIVLIFLFPLQALTNEKIEEESQKVTLSAKYNEGSILIYDCEDEHWVCADKVAEDECSAQRRKEITENEFQLSCAVFKSFKQDQSCFNEQKRLIINAVKMNFCTNFKYKY